MNSVRKLWYTFCKNIFIYLPYQHYILILRRIQYFRLGFKYYPLNLKNPQTFSDHLNLLKCQELTIQHTICADKFEVRNFVKEKIGEEYLIPLLGVTENAEELLGFKLPVNYVVKANHGSGWNLIVQDSSNINWKKEIPKLNYWLSLNAYYLSREKQYKSIAPRLVIEKSIGFEPNDYKFFCFNGIAKVIQVDFSRFTNHQRSLFDINWQLLPIRIRYPQITESISPPSKLDEMIKIAENLADSFKFVRVDLYEVNGNVYFGEMTFFPGGGTEPFLSYEEDLLMGQYFN